MSASGSAVQRPWADDEPDSLVHTLGRPMDRGRRWPHLLAYPVVLVAGVAIGLISAGSADTAAASSPNVTSSTLAAPIVTSSTLAASPMRAQAKAIPADVASFADGTYLVGADIDPGGYTTEGSDGETCYWARLRDTNGAFGSVITSGNITARTTVAVEHSDDAFQVSGGCLWTRR
jgi:hypothetical protein